MMALISLALPSAADSVAETIRIFRKGSFQSFQTTKVEVRNDLPTPRKPWMNRLFGPLARNRAMSN